MRHAARLGRATALWAISAAATALAVRVLGPDARALLRSDARTVEGLLVGSCSAALLACAAWALLVTTAVVAEAICGVRVPGVPRHARRALLAACGVAVAGGLAVPAGAGAAIGTAPGTEPAPDTAASRLAGLPLPDRAHAAPRPALRPAAPLAASTAHTVVVAPGDSLWRLTEADLAAARRVPTPPAPAAVQRHLLRVLDLNHDRIGDDPDLIHPGQRLRMPR